VEWSESGARRVRRTNRRRLTSFHECKPESRIADPEGWMPQALQYYQDNSLPLPTPQ
jgi:hypothetical protein